MQRQHAEGRKEVRTFPLRVDGVNQGCDQAGHHLFSKPLPNQTTGLAHRAEYLHEVYSTVHRCVGRLFSTMSIYLEFRTRP